MNLRKRNNETAEVSTEALNDIMFFLLLFFLIISTLVNPSVIKLNLANSKNSQTIEVKSVTIQITKKMEYFIDNKPISFGNLESEINRVVKKMADPTVILRLDKELTIQDLVDVMQIGAKLKVKMVLATKPPNSEK